MEATTTATMTATVLAVRENNLLVCEHAFVREVIVHTDSACCFSCGDRVCIRYSGAMTMSIPPQISAHSITRLGCC